MLERIEADTRWEKLFADPRSKDALKRLAAEAEAEIERGDVTRPAGAGLEVADDQALLDS